MKWNYLICTWIIAFLILKRPSTKRHNTNNTTEINLTKICSKVKDDISHPLLCINLTLAKKAKNISSVQHPKVNSPKNTEEILCTRYQLWAHCKIITRISCYKANKWEKVQKKWPEFNSSCSAAVDILIVARSLSRWRHEVTGHHFIVINLHFGKFIIEVSKVYICYHHT